MAERYSGIPMQRQATEPWDQAEMALHRIGKAGDLLSEAEKDLRGLDIVPQSQRAVKKLYDDLESVAKKLRKALREQGGR